MTGYERGTFEERSARTELLPRQSRKNSEDDSRANNNIRETLGILSLGLHYWCLHEDTSNREELLMAMGASLLTAFNKVISEACFCMI